MTYRELLEFLSRRIGGHQIPLNAEATELRGLVESGAVHYELMTQVATAVYTANRCRRLGDPVTLDATFEALEPIRLAVLRSPGTDVDAHSLIEAICAEVAQAFGVLALDDDSSPSSGGAVVRFRRRLRF